MKPFSEACERNKGPILEVLREAFADRRAVLEVGSGTGQHALHFARSLPHLTWQPGDVATNLPGLQAQFAGTDSPNLQPPVVLDLDEDWPPLGCEALFSANTLHIVSWPQVQRFFRHAGEQLPPGGVLAVYGPFNYGGRFSSPSNAHFDAMLRARDPDSGIRDFEAVDALAREQGFVLTRDVAMPANNRTLVWRK
jgi:SAM-dependent methyltransferase